jgi:Pyruvate/2-oxoacid:ferredoxin oxidoreductase gamma subunit
LAASIFSYAASLSGLYTTQKGSYPVTVGVGFSSSELNISNEEILFHGIELPDYAIITSIDGLNYSKNKISKMTENQTVFIDSSLDVPQTKANLERYDFRKVGAKNAALFSLMYFIKKTNIFEFEAIIEAVKEQKLEDKVDLKKLIQEIE